jgi:hypothetical protein
MERRAEMRWGVDGESESVWDSLMFLKSRGLFFSTHHVDVGRIGVAVGVRPCLDVAMLCLACPMFYHVPT